MTDYSSHETDGSIVNDLTKLINNTVPAVDVKFEDGRHFIVHRNDFAFTDKSLLHAVEVLQPKTVVQTPNLQTATSLRDYIKRFKNEDTLVFASIATNTIMAAIDYHKEPEEGIDPVARLNTHNAILKLEFSKEWATWIGQNEKLMSHERFADFLEENALDVDEPRGGDLLELCRDLHVKSGMQFKSSIRMGDTVSIEYQKENDASSKNGMTLPAEFTLELPVYFDEPNVKVRCLLRRKIDDGQLFLGYKMVRYENVRQDEFKRIVEGVSVETDTLALYGAK